MHVCDYTVLMCISLSLSLSRYIEREHTFILAYKDGYTGAIIYVDMTIYVRLYR